MRLSILKIWNREKLISAGKGKRIKRQYAWPLRRIGLTNVKNG
jgi:hypothetical protein